LAGAKTVEIFNLDFFKFGPRKRGAKSTPGFRGELPKGWGAWDAKEEGFSPEALETFLRDDTFYIAPKSLFYPEVPEGYFKRKDGIYRVIEKAKEEEPGLQKICSLIEIEALTRDSNDTNWGRRLVIEDIDGGRHSWNMPMGLYGHDPKEVRTELFRLGATLNQSPAAKHAFDEYIQNTNPSGRFIIAGKTGWLDHGTFVLPHRTISCISSRVLYQSEVAVLDHVKNSGTLEDWQNEVCRLTVANSRLIFAIAVALSGPLLNVTGEKNYGCHIVGISSTGKTTNLQVAASVWGPHGFIQTWRATDNGLEAVAESHSDLVLLLDEIAEISPKVLGKTVYMLVNGLGKKRMKADSSLRVSKKWRLPILSVGETTLKTAIEQDSSNPMVRAGQELRLLSIEAESTGSQGLFNCIHEFTDASEFARHLSTVTKNHFGVAGPSFVRALIKLGPRKIGLLWGKYKKKFFKDVVPKNSTAQVCRTANTFALIAFTSFLSSRLGITVWTPHEAEEAIAQCFRDWMNSLDSQMPDIDSGPILSRVRTFFEAHAESRFSELDKERRGRATLNRAGFVNRGSDGDIVEYLVLPQVFRSEFCKGFTHKHVTTVLIDNGILVPGERRRTSQSRLIKGESRTRLYVFPASKVLEGGEQ
jgi:putative DNA primase/helicase